MSELTVGSVTPLPGTTATPLDPFAAKPVVPITPVVISSLAPPADNATAVNVVSDLELRAELIWGGSGNGKDQQCWQAVYYTFMVKEKKSLILSAESLGSGLQMAVDLGMADVVSVTGVARPMDLVAAIIKGKRWPVKKTVNGQLTYDLKDPKAVIDGSKYGLIIINSMTSLGDMFKFDIATDPSKILPMTPGEDKYKVKIGETTYGGGSPTHIGFIHDRMYEYIVASCYLPCDKVLWTARQQLGAQGEKKDKQGNVIKQGIPVIGPELPGSAATSRVTSWFGGAYHVDAVQIGEKEDSRKDAPGLYAAKMVTPVYEYRLYLQPHNHPEFGVKFDVKNRLLGAINDKLLAPDGPTKGKPYIVCTEKQNADGTFVHTGINTIWEVESAFAEQTRQRLGADERFQKIMRRFD